MANEEQLSILKQGVEVWNKWREENPDVEIDLSRAELSFYSLTSANLKQANLEEVNLGGAKLQGAKLIETNLMQAKLDLARLNSADLTRANLRQASLVEANLDHANLHQARLPQANLTKAFLVGADLSQAILHMANLGYTALGESKLFSARIGSTIIAGVNLSKTIGLDSVYHDGPSQVSTDTFILSKRKIPGIFLQGCGLSDWEIEVVKLYDPDLSNDEISNIQYRMYDLRATQALQISPLFISYSHGDGTFVDKIEKKLNIKGIRFWRDIHDMKAGRIETQIDRAITQNRTVLLVLSEYSIKSDWVEHEVRTARGLEKQSGRDVLCPIALDDSWKKSPWPARVMEQIMEYNILDFSAWEDDAKFDSMFRKLIDGLELFYKDKVRHGE